ncbi:xanthine dehydrogenase family protein molybdopterin-binding subunit [Pseudoruegeria sp. SK021]|uniref:xanthine dehydrogenase family protein molybdopterin-binding subunit n=1 Tax=Pseudoruegeria sp. SK021 TaxID=1933035 RepID=UPI000A21835F|nr:molybdopterin cofactor-binding domain-containing protein [Pseudoruegeria sp. SK021]OSP53927.1 dehydrogenase [Pseudoruegeria sp. SK021]
MTSIEFRKDLFANERDDTLNEIGKPTIRQDILGHVTGRTPFYDDHLFDGLLHMRAVRSPHHHARIRSLDTAAAERMPGVRRVVKPGDVPNNLNTLLSLIGFGKDDEPLLSGQKVSYKGEPVCAVIADTEAQARAAVAAVRVDWEVLPHVLDVEEALAPGAPSVNPTYPNNTFDYHERYDHQKLRFGDVQAGFAQADHIIEAEYQMSPIEQAPIETCGAIAAPEQNDRYVCHTNTQALFFSLGTTAKLLNLASSRLHFIGGTAGGGFGGKVDSIVEPMAVLGAVLTGRPVKFAWDRPEEMQVGAPRGAERWRIKDGVRRDGRIVAREFTGFFDSGAYTRLSSYAIIKGVGHLPGPYSIPNVAANVYCVFTNRTPATAMRGFGITGVDFSIEVQMDRVAEAVGMNPIDLRILNAYRDGDMKAHRRVAKNTALIECCQVAAGKAGWAISSESTAASSLVGGGEGARGTIPETVTDQEGLIGARRAGRVTDTAPARTGTGRVAAGHAGVAIVAAPPQREDMQIAADRIGHRMGSGPGAVPPPVAPRPSGPVPARPAASAGPVPPRGSITPPPGFAPPQAPPTPPSVPVPYPTYAAPPPAPPQPPAPASAAPYAPDQPFSRGVKRPGASPFLSGTRRR